MIKCRKNIRPASRSGTTLTLEPIDFTEEPDGNLPDFTTYANFIERQSRLSTLLSSTDLELVDETGARYPHPSEAPSTKKSPPKVLIIRRHCYNC